MKIRPNEPCPCGSGKKYKKCCKLIGGFEKSSIKNRTLQYMKTHDSSAILNMIIGMQLNPNNRGANVRMERLSMYAAQTLNTGKIPLNITEFKSILNEEFALDYNEDYPINLHSETMVWIGGNHTIYPGIAIHSTDILDAIKIAIFQSDEKWPESFFQKVRQAFSLLLSLGDRMSELSHSKGYVRGGDQRMHRLDYSLSEIDFSISEEEMQSLLRREGISLNVLDAFLLDVEREKRALMNDDIDNNPLLKRPIVKHDGKYYFLLISNQADALRRYVLSLAQEFGCINQLVDIIYRTLVSRLLDVFFRMEWVPFTINLGGEKLQNSKEYVFQIDRNCYAYVCFIHDCADDWNNNRMIFTDLSERLDVIEQIIWNKVGQDKQLLSIVLYASLGECSGLTSSRLPKSLNIIWPAYSFITLSKIEKWERLDLLRYAEAKTKIIDRILPFADPIDVYALYKTHNQSFYFTDDTPHAFIVPEPNEGCNLIQDSKIRMNYHAVLQMSEGRKVYRAVERASEDFLMYKPIHQDDIYMRCIDNGDIPIWVLCEQNALKLQYASIWGTAILYWLYFINEQEDISSYLSDHPQEIQLYFEEENLEVPYIIEHTTNGIHMTISNNAIKTMMSPNNSEERQMIAACINALTRGEYGNILVDKYIPIGLSKMILVYEVDPLSMANPTNLCTPLLLSDASKNKFLDELPLWMVEAGVDFSGKLQTQQEKERALHNIVAVCLERVKEMISQYKYEHLLRIAIWHHDTLIWKRERDRIYNPAQVICFGKDQIREQEIGKSELQLTRTDIGLRCLIEYLAAQPYDGGSKKIGDYELDYIVTIMCEVVSYGSMCDLIRCNMSNMTIEHLDSGRYGIEHDEFWDKLYTFQIAYNEENIENQLQHFPFSFVPKKQEKGSSDDKLFIETNEAFYKDWGISFQDLGLICYNMSKLCVDKGESVLQLSEDNVVKEICEMSQLSDSAVRVGISRLSLQERNKFLEAPDGYENHEVYPWRYNREFSFIRRFIVREKSHDGEIYLIFGQRNAISAFKQLSYLLVNGLLNVPMSAIHIKEVIGKYSKEKGADFNNQVRDFLKDNTELNVIDYDVKITKDYPFYANENYGDIDVLAYDSNTQVVYNIECKDTMMAKNMYQMYNELRKYLGLNEKKEKRALVWKHFRRHEWLTLHKTDLARFLKLKEVLDVKSIIITSQVLPVSYLGSNRSPLPIVSYLALKQANGNLEELIKNYVMR